MRSLATIQTIKNLDTIPGKDRIVLATFENVGFKVIVGKTDFQVGDKCIYVEADSILPVRPEFEFLRSRCFSPSWDGFRIKCMKMGNTFSEGIAFNLSLLTFVNDTLFCIKGIDGEDVTNELKIIKYDPEAREEALLMEQRKSKHGPVMRFLLKFPFIKNLIYPKKKSSRWPDWASKTDETRVQILPYVYEDLKGMEVYATEKMDGQSLTAGYIHRRFTLCSRNMALPKPSKITGQFARQKSLYWQTVEKYDIEKKLERASKELGIDLYIQGEQCGPTIQSNKYNFPDLQFFVYNVKDVTHDRYFDMQELINFCREYDFEMVRILSIDSFEWKSVDELVSFAKGKSVYADIPREGIVIRSVFTKPPKYKMANMLSFKVINPDFMLKYKEEEGE